MGTLFLCRFPDEKYVIYFLHFIKHMLTKSELHVLKSSKSLDLIENNYV